MSQFHGFSLDGFVLTEIDGRGCQWTVEDIQGWFTGGDVRTATVARSQQNGDWRGRGLRGGRLITLRGKVFCPDATALELSSRDFASVLSSGGFGEFVGYSAAGTLSAQVQLDDAPLFDPQSDRHATWQITVGSEDNLLYGPPTFATTTLAASAGGTGLLYPLSYPLNYGLAPGVTPGALDLPNAGTASYFPRLRIDGAVTNPVVTLAETGAQIRYAGTVAAGQWLDIDCARRRVLLNGVVSMRHKVSFVGAWPTVPVGGGTLSWSADSYGSSHQLSSWAFEGAWT